MPRRRVLGLRIGLHAAGPYPEWLAAMLPLFDRAGFDVKAAFAACAHITGGAGSGVKAKARRTQVLAGGASAKLLAAAMSWRLCELCNCLYSGSLSRAR